MTVCNYVIDMLLLCYVIVMLLLIMCKNTLLNLSIVI